MIVETPKSHRLLQLRLYNISGSSGGYEEISSSWGKKSISFKEQWQHQPLKCGFPYWIRFLFLCPTHIMQQKNGIGCHRWRYYYQKCAFMVEIYTFAGKIHLNSLHIKRFSSHNPFTAILLLKRLHLKMNPFGCGNQAQARPPLAALHLILQR